MSRVEIKVPEVAESIEEVFVGEWLKAAGDAVARDETVLTIDTDKTAIEVPAPVAGVLGELQKQEGDQVSPGDVLATIDTDAQASGEAAGSSGESSGRAKPAQRAAGERPKGQEPAPVSADVADPPEPAGGAAGFVMPAAQRLLDQNGLQAEQVRATGPGGRLLKEDVLRHIEGDGQSKSETRSAGTPAKAETRPARTPAGTSAGSRDEEVVPMTPLRRRVAANLVQAQQQAALLTTFNEADMSAVMELRGRYKESFAKEYDIKLGFMSFFVKAVVDALKRFPSVNAEVRGTDVAYRNYCDVGVAIGGGKGLVVPVLRNAERLSFAEIESRIADFAKRAQANKLDMSELTGGTFTISNGGVYGSLLSTPIVNPPQSGILGMHAIKERPVVVDGAIVVRPMMYLALSYDHRVVDGRESVGFLKRVVESIEDPTRMLMEI